jgi:YD repeat-containing protein
VAVSCWWGRVTVGQPIGLRTAGQHVAFECDDAGRETSWRLDAVTLSQTWDANHRLHTQALTAQGQARQQRLVQRRAYTYRAEVPSPGCLSGQGSGWHRLSGLGARSEITG